MPGGVGVVWELVCVVVVVVGASTRVGLVLSQEGVGHALPSANMFDDLLLRIKHSILPTLYPILLFTLNPYDSENWKSDQNESLAKQLIKQTH